MKLQQLSSELILQFYMLFLPKLSAFLNFVAIAVMARKLACFHGYALIPI
jgi:hypothetical protein